MLFSASACVYTTRHQRASFGLASVPLSTLRRPGIVPVALRVRPVLGVVGLSLLGAVAVIYLLGGRLGA